MKPHLPPDFTPIQCVCADYIETVIRTVSEEHYAASFMLEIDYWLYAETVNQKSIHLEDYILQNLETCRNTINGWIIWDLELHNPQFMKNEDVVRQIEDIKKKRKKT
jgi:hypothetical protein